MKPAPVRLTFEAAMARLYELENQTNIEGQRRFGIRPAKQLGIAIPRLREIAKGQRDHALAEALWNTGVHEARILAAFVDDPKQVTPEQMDAWAEDFDSWDVVDQVCWNLFEKTPYAIDKIHAWSQRSEEFVRRAAFALIAGLAVHDKRRPDEDFHQFFPLITQASTDERNFVKKAVNWALRGLGKRSEPLRQVAIQTARQIEALDSPTARWVARDALKELEPAGSGR